MSKHNNLIVSGLAAILIPTLASIFCFGGFFLLSWQPGQPAGKILALIAVVSFGVSFLLVLAFGLPIVLVLRRINFFNGWSVVGAGFTLACVVTGIILHPRHPEGMTFISGGTATVIKGVVTAAGWLNYLIAVTVMGGLGALSASAFWCTWRKRSNTAVNAEPPSATRLP
jgi:hypothetical protein